MEGAIVVTSLVPIEQWSDGFGEAVAAEAICDRLLCNAY